VSQTITPPAAPATAPPGPADPGPIGRVVVSVQRGLEGTPGKLRIAAGVAILAAIVAGLGGGAALRARAVALSDAQESAANLVLLQGVRTNLGQADADAANAFLRGGLEPQSQQRQYVSSLAAASRDLAAAARGANDKDATTLGVVNDELTTYAGLVESARANNRQGYPVGASYLDTASTLMGDKILAQLSAVATNEERRTGDAYDRAGRAAIWLVLTAVLGIGTLIAVQVWLARRSRRVVNLPAALATLLLFVVLVGAASIMAVAQGKANDIRSGSYARAASLGQARVKAFNAKSQEALTLVARGSATAADKEWKDSYNEAVNAVQRAGGDSTMLTPLKDYATAHTTLNDADVNGDWDRAVKLANTTREEAPNLQTANKAFDDFADASGASLAAAARSTDEGLDGARSGLMPIGFLVVLAGLLAAGGVWWGISLRLDEYR
jgi:hypothetical protein